MSSALVCGLKRELRFFVAAGIKSSAARFIYQKRSVDCVMSFIISPPYFWNDPVLPCCPPHAPSTKRAPARANTPFDSRIGAMFSCWAGWAIAVCAGRHQDVIRFQPSLTMSVHRVIVPCVWQFAAHLLYCIWIVSICHYFSDLAPLYQRNWCSDRRWRAAPQSWRTLPDFAGRLLLLLAVSSRPFCPKFHSYLFIIYLSIYFECG